MIEKNKTDPFDKLAKPAQRALANAKIKTLEELSKLTEAEFMKLHGIGKNALQAIKEAMTKENLSFSKRE